MTTYTENKNIYRERGERIRTIRGMLRMTMAEFATLCGYKEPTVQQWETSHISGLTEKAARNVTEALKKTPILCELDWLLSGQGIPPSVLSQDKTIAKYQLELQSLISGINSDTYTKNEMERFQTFIPNAVVMQVQDDGMEPAFWAGDYVGGQNLSDENREQALGKICIIQLTDNKLLLRKLFKDDEGPHKFKLACINTQSATLKPILTNVSILSAAPITRLWRLYIK